MHHLCRHSRSLSGKGRLPLVAEAYQAGLITDETAHFYSTRKGVISRAVDDFKKSHGEEQATIGLRLDHA